MKKMMEPEASLLTIKYYPNDETLTENPPRFTWVPESQEDLRYRLQISQDSEFGKQRTTEIRELPYNFYTLDYVLKPGNYYWRYALDDDTCNYSKIRKFTIAEDAVSTPLIGRKERYTKVELSHPRIWLNKEGIEKFKDNLKIDSNYCSFQQFYKQSVLNYQNMEFPKEPLPYPNHKRVISLWRKNYMDCQEALCYIRTLSVGGVLTEDLRLIELAKNGLLQIADWDMNGPTKRDYNDECAFRVAYALAFGYDWLYEYLSEEEKKHIMEQLFLRTKEVADHIIIDTRIHYSLYDSHAVRSLSSVIIPCCIVLLGDYPQAKDWLDYAVEYLSVIYTPWGGADGGWAEGPAYWTTGMAFVTEAMNTLKSFTGIDLYQRPFFQKTGDFPLYCNPVDTYRASFGDQSNLGDYPGHKVAFNIRQFAGVTGNKDYLWYYEKVMEREPLISSEFYNKGWWDFYYDEMTYSYEYHDSTFSEVEETAAVKWFKDIGWVSIHQNLKDFKNHVMFLTKSSPYGSVSHSHGDQNSFVLFAYGEPLIIESGYYVGFNSSMHRDWRRQTKAHNTILINGQGQYADMDKVKQLNAKGNICQVKESSELVYIKEDATDAYRELVPDIKEYTREIYYVSHDYFVLVDSVETEEESYIDWNLHSQSPFEIEKNNFSIYGDKANLEGKIVYCSSVIDSIVQNDQFSGVNQEELEGLKNQWHLTMRTKKAKKHVIVSLLVPERKEERKMVSSIKDDQGMDIYYYFNCGGKTWSLKVDGSCRY